MATTLRSRSARGVADISSGGPAQRVRRVERSATTSITPGLAPTVLPLRRGIRCRIGRRQSGVAPGYHALVRVFHHDVLLESSRRCVWRRGGQPTGARQVFQHLTPQRIIDAAMALVDKDDDRSIAQAGTGLYHDG